MKQIVDKAEAKGSRRLYKTQWERAKRKRLRESRVETVNLEVPRSLAKRLRAWTPKGVGFTNFLLRVLSAGTGGKPLRESAEAYKRRTSGKAVWESALDARPAPVVVVQPVIARNARCPCGSGRKWKRCCGRRR